MRIALLLISSLLVGSLIGIGMTASPEKTVVVSKATYENQDGGTITQVTSSSGNESAWGVGSSTLFIAFSALCMGGLVAIAIIRASARKR